MKIEAIESHLKENLIWAATQEGCEESQVREHLAEMETPRDSNHGDLATSFVLKIAKSLKTNPRDLGQRVVKQLKSKMLGCEFKKYYAEVSLAGPGFINIALSQEALTDVLLQINAETEKFGCGESKKTNVLLEYVSANPTGPLTIAHGRQAALGDTLIRILKFAGFKATSEYYNNDSGVQIKLLGASVAERCRELAGLDFEFPENGYKGDYIADLARQMLDNASDKSWLEDKDKTYQKCAAYAKDIIMTGIKKDLKEFDVHFDSYYSQEALDNSGKVEETLDVLKKAGHVYENEGATWFKSTSFGDDKDRVLIKSDKAYTYFTPDIAYHRDKFNRGFDRLINILGPDHHGYIPRLKAAGEALGYQPDQIHVLIAQLVTLFEGKTKLRMSTRAGEFITLRQLVDDVGKDAARFFFLMRKCDSHLNFDLKLAKEKSSDNPVYYIQYVHARIASIFRSAKEKGVNVSSKPDLTCLNQKEELALLKSLRLFPKIVQASANQLEPHILMEYLTQVASYFHPFYQACRVIEEDERLRDARLFLIGGVQRVIRNGLTLLGVSSPESM